MKFRFDHSFSRPLQLHANQSVGIQPQNEPLELFTEMFLEKFETPFKCLGHHVNCKSLGHTLVWDTLKSLRHSQTQQAATQLDRNATMIARSSKGNPTKVELFLL